MDNKLFIQNNSVELSEGMQVWCLGKYFRYYPKKPEPSLEGKFAIGEASTSYVKDGKMFLIANCPGIANALDECGFQYESFHVPLIALDDYSDEAPRVILADPNLLEDCNPL